MVRRQEASPKREGSEGRALGSYYKCHDTHIFFFFFNRLKGGGKMKQTGSSMESSDEIFELQKILIII